MKPAALAADFDGTIAYEGVVAPRTVQALRAAKASGLSLLLVTGRELASLFNTFAETAVFDLIVAENGAVLHDPRSGTIQQLAPAAPPSLIALLTKQNVPLSVGHSIVATVEPHGPQMAEAIRALNLPWEVIPNKDSLMALPAGVSKATGLLEALKSLSIDASDTVAVGDAENDLALLTACGFAVAVHNALPGVKRVAHLVTDAENGDGVVELIERLLAGHLDASVREASA